MLLPLGALAQTPPDAGAVRQQLEREREARLPRQAAPQAATPSAPQPEQKGVLVTVRQFHFSGNTLLDAARLEQAVAPFLNRPLDFTQLQAAAAAVAAAYRDAGWIVRAFLPRQDIDRGEVTIEVVEAVFGGVRLDSAPARVSEGRLRALFARGLTQGAPFNTAALDRALLLADDLPGVAVSGTLQEGSAARETVLVLKTVDEPLWSGDAALDNTGSRSTGPLRASANLAVNSALGFGDQWNLNAVHSKGSDYLRAAFSAPVGHDGWRVGLNASALAYRLVAPEFAALAAKGRSTSAGADANYPLLRSRMRNLYLSVSAERKAFSNEANGATTTDYHVDGISAGLSGNLFDSLFGGGASSASLTFSHGRVDLAGSPNAAADAAGHRTAGSFSKVRYALARQQVLTETVSLYAALSGQGASRHLDSAEKFYLGGVYGVRAYPSSEAGGDKGQLANLELRARLLPALTLTGFYDWGRVSFAHADASTPAVTLKGAGLALGWLNLRGPAVKAVWARRIGENPNRSSSGADQDGSLHRNRFWLTVSQPF
ncbi:MAG: ShlB/FhaC/HecB family hemolysin secretion/activation protein [Gammaproteobacteria bacterium]